MAIFPLNTLQTAPERARPALRQLQDSFGMIPNLIAAISNSPVLINSLVGMFGNVHGGSFTEAEVQILLLTDAVTNESSWAVAFHTALGLKAGLEPADVQAIRERRLPREPKHAALSLLAQSLIQRRGHIDASVIDQFVAAGFAQEQVLEAIAAVAASTITNYAGNVTQPPLDEAFQAHAWTP